MELEHGTWEWPAARALSPLRRAPRWALSGRPVWVHALLSLCVAAGALTLTAALPTPARAAEANDGGIAPSAEALLVRGIRHFEGRAMREGLRELEEAVGLRLHWEPARRALAYALIRSGRFERAEEELTRLIGAATVEALQSGEATIGDMAVDIEAEDLLGLAIARGETRAYRAADLLYRSYADLVGPSTPRAARAFRRLADMYTKSAVEWGDAEVEAARALALDPEIASRSTLPEFPNPTDHTELEPYTRVIALALGTEAPEEGFDRLPLLAGWRPPDGVDLTSRSRLRRTADVEILVGEDGSTIQVRLPESIDQGGARAAAIESAVGDWLFEPALSGGDPVEAWITFEVEIPLEAARKDSTARAQQDSTAPAQPDSATPARPDSATPARPDSATPARPDSTAPARWGWAAPGQHDTQEPAALQEVVPSGRSDEEEGSG